MHTQVVTFGLKGINETEYHDACQGETAVFASIPGLLAKIWLRDTDKDTYGAVYLWRDRDSCEEYKKGEIFKSMVQDPTLVNVTSRDFEIYDDLTKATQPGLNIV